MISSADNYFPATFILSYFRTTSFTEHSKGNEFLCYQCEYELFCQSECSFLWYPEVRIPQCPFLGTSI